MDPVLIAIAGLIGMFILIAAHAPVGAAMGIAATVTFAAFAGAGPGFAVLGAEAVSAVTSVDFAIIPLFLLMGGFAVLSGLSTDLGDVARSLLGHRRGGLAIAAISVSALFGAVCGSAIASVATVTRVCLPDMLKHNYKPGFAAGVIAASATLGVIIPPSLILVIYAILAEIDVLTLFAAAIAPGILATILQIAAAALYAGFRPGEAPSASRQPWATRIGALKRAWAVILLGATITVGIYGGFFTVNEAAAVGACGAFLLCVIRRRLTRRTFAETARDVARSAGAIYVIVIGAFAMSYFLAASNLPQSFVGTVGALDIPPIAVIIAFYAMYLVLGALFEPLAVMVVSLPFVLPAVTALGYDPVWWGVMLVMVSGIGMVTPPIGMNVFVLHGMRNDIPLTEIYRGVTPFFFADLVRVGVLTAFPAIVTWLPARLGMM
jgi:tripartite ATP-independent transporter DctM subunit